MATNGQLTVFNGKEVIYIDAIGNAEEGVSFFYGIITKKTRKGVELQTNLLIQGTKENATAKFLEVAPGYVNPVCKLEKLELKWIHGGYPEEVKA